MEPSYKAQELCRIIETCHKNGVAVLKFSDVEITFDRPLGPVAMLDQPKAHQEVFSEPDSPEAQKPLMHPIDETVMEEVRRSQLLVDNPVAFEQEMIDECLGRQKRVNGHAPDEDRRTQPAF